MPVSYLVRYGLMGRVGRFTADADGFERGQTVVIRSHRGTELGEILVTIPPSSEPDVASAWTASARVLRAASSDDLDRARRAEGDRSSRFALCRRVFEDGVWPLELVDVEPLLDDRRTVLHYLGPHRLDTAGLLSAFRAACDLDVMLEPVGRDVSDLEEAHEEANGHGCGHCGEGGGCGTGGCGSASGGAHAGCGSCAVKDLIASRRMVASG